MFMEMRFGYFRNKIQITRAAQMFHISIYKEACTMVANQGDKTDGQDERDRTVSNVQVMELLRRFP